MSFATVAVLGMAALQALAHAPSGLDPTTRARPDHEVDIGDSLPRSNRASNIMTTDTGSTIAPTLPSLALRHDATTRDDLTTACASLVAGRTSQAQQSLEMAETRVLSRAVPQGQTATPSDSRLVSGIRDARRALGGGDSPHAIQLIDRALAG